MNPFDEFTQISTFCGEVARGAPILAESRVQGGRCRSGQASPGAFYRHKRTTMANNRQSPHAQYVAYLHQGKLADRYGPAAQGLTPMRPGSTATF